jgi:membrane protease YdiL (CAAX protease family)
MFHVLIAVLCQHWLHVKEEAHGIEKLMRAAPGLSDWLLTILTAIVAAPILEEFLYRGVLQSWMIRQAYRSDNVYALTFAVALLLREPGLTEAFTEHTWESLQVELQPAAFVLAMLPIYLVIRLRLRSAAAAGIFCSALFFAINHAAVWPSPIPLFPLGLALGYLAYRTQSLIAPMVLHALFNSVAIVGLMHQAPPPAAPPKGNDVTSAVRFVPAASTSSLVPGVSCPRRM